MAKAKKLVKKLTAAQATEEWLSWINSWNYLELRVSLEKHLAKYGYSIQEKK